MDKYVLCITGASGVRYGLKILQELSKNNQVYLLISQNGYIVLEREEGIKREDLKSLVNQNVILENCRNIASPIASGSRLVEFKGVIVAPCSMNTLACIANGIAQNLIHRVCDVALKENVKMFLLLREMPLSLTHLENMLKAKKAGCDIAVASPAFYHKPRTIDDMVNFVAGKVLDAFKVKHNLYQRWGG